MIYFQKPENALKRANEFSDVGKTQAALDALHAVINSRKHRAWTKIHEPIMMKYLELCVELKKSFVAKEGLFQYRNICQHVNVKSLEDVIHYYIELAEQKTEAAKEESQAIVDIDDLEHIQTPENLLLCAVSNEDTQDRNDRVILAPRVKFLWESYRHCLELLRNNCHYERLYHEIAAGAFKFCCKYNRKFEFRLLCDNLRNHFGIINKYKNQQTSVNLNNIDSQSMHLETRLAQLDAAVQMELYQEAFKANEDIYALLNLSKKTPNPKLMANYYQKQALVFWMNRNYLFHAAALFRLFYISKEQKKNITADEIVKLASKVVLATLAIPLAPYRTNIDQLVEIDDSVIDKNNRILSNLLGLSNPPTRALLIKDLVRFGIIHNAPPELKDLFQWLEIEFDPLKLCNRIQQCIDFLITWEDYPELCQYIPLIKEITIVRLVKEISQVYETIKISRLLELAPFVDSFQLEYLVLKIARQNDLQVRIDHKRQCFRFGAELNVSQREEIIDGPHLQSMISECVRNLLVHYSSALNKAFNVIQPDNIKLKYKDLAKEISKAYMLASSKDHIRLLNRQQIIEERKEMLENQTYLKETEEKKFLEEKLQKFREAEKERLQKEAGERAKQRLLQEESEMKKKIVMEKIEQLKKTGIGSKIFEEMAVEELEKLDPVELLNKHFAQIEREKKDMQTKLKNQERKVDHYERAKRCEEISLLLQEYNQTKLKDVEFWDQHEKERINAINEERALAVQERERLMRLRDDKEAFLEHLKKTRAFKHQEKYEEFNKKLQEEKKKRLEERKQKRKEERRTSWLVKQEEMRQRQIEEEIKREREEALAKLQEIEAKKRAKEKEIEERLIREEAAALERKREEEKTLNRAKEAEKPNLSWRERELENRQRLPREEKDKDFSRNLDDRDRSDAWKRKVDRPKEIDGSWRREEPPTSRRGERSERDRIPWVEKDREYSRKPNDNDRPDAWRRKADRPQEGGGSWRREDPPTSRSERPERDRLSKEENDRESSRNPDHDRPDAWKRKANRPQEGGGSWRREDPPTSRSERPERDRLSREENDRGSSRNPDDHDRSNGWRRKADRPQEGGGSWRREDPSTSRRGERTERDRLSREENDRGSSRKPDDQDKSDGWRKVDRPQRGSWRREDPPTSRR